MSQSIDKSLKTASQTIENIRNLKIVADQLNTEVNEEINSYKIQEPAYSNQLLNPDTPLKTLKKTYLDINTSLRTITSRYNDLKQKQEEAQKLSMQVDGFMAIAEGQIQEIRSEAESTPEVQAVIEKLENLLASLATKKDFLKSTREIYISLHDRLNGTQQHYVSLFNKLNGIIENRKNQDLLERKTFVESMGVRINARHCTKNLSSEKFQME